MKPVLESEEIIEIPFYDVDAMQVAWHGHYLKYFEIARTSLLKLFDYDYPKMYESGYVWPVIECKCRFIKPARYGMKIRVIAKLNEYENRLKINYLIHDHDSGERICKGHTIQVAVDKNTNDMCFVSPPILFERLAQIFHKKTKIQG